MAARRSNGEGTEPFQRPGRSGWYQVVWITDPRTGTGKKVWLSAPTKKALAEKRRTTLGNARAGLLPTSSKKITLAEYVVEWEAGHLMARKITPGTRQSYRRMIKNHIVPSLGHVKLAKLQPRDVELMDVELQAKGLGDSGRRVCFGVLSMICDTAIRDGYLSLNPTKQVDRPVETPTHQPYYKPEQLRRLFQEVKGERVLENLVPLLTWTGIRIGEALALRWADIELDSKPPKLWVRGTTALDDDDHVYRQSYPKGKRPRPIPLVADAVKALKAQKATQAEERLALGEVWQAKDVESEPVFASTVGTLLDARNLRRRYNPFVRRVGLAGSFHSLRRSTATMLSASKAPLNVVSAILGHSNTRVTESRYAIIDTDIVEDALNEMEKWWTQSGEN